MTQRSSIDHVSKPSAARWNRLVARSASRAVTLSLAAPAAALAWVFLMPMAFVSVAPDAFWGSDFLAGVAAIGWLVGLVLISATPPVAVVLAHVSVPIAGSWRRSAAALIASYLSTGFMLWCWVLLFSLTAAGFD
jgi:hypothetical protein